MNDSWGNISKNLSQKYIIGELKKKKNSLMATFRKLANRVKSSKKKRVQDWMTSSNLTGSHMKLWLNFYMEYVEPHTTKNS